MSQNERDELAAEIADLQPKHVGNTEFANELIEIAKAYLAMAVIEGEFD